MVTIFEGECRESGQAPSVTTQHEGGIVLGPVSQ
jgi:hypothetical protein